MQQQAKGAKLHFIHFITTTKKTGTQASFVYKWCEICLCFKPFSVNNTKGFFYSKYSLYLKVYYEGCDRRKGRSD